MNIVIPMAGHGSRFQKAGYTFPKPLIEVFGKPMIQIIIENLNFWGDDIEYTFLVLKEHCDKFALNYLLPLITRGHKCHLVQVDHVTEGAACTVLLAKEFINNDRPILIANSDQWIDWSSEHFLNYMKNNKADGGILTFFSTHPKWSFAKIDELSNKIIEVAEKKPISHNATVGIYYFAKGSDFVQAAEEMIAKDLRVNGEFYVCPTYNQLIQAGKTILNYPVAEMRGLGTPEDLNLFLSKK